MGCPAISFGSVLDGGFSGADDGSAGGTAQGSAEDPP